MKTTEQVLNKIIGNGDALTVRPGLRHSGETISLTSVSGGSFTIPEGCTRFRLVADLRVYYTAMLLIGYTGPVGQSNASMICKDTNEVFDDAEEGTTVYFSAVDMADCTPVECTAYDKVHVSYYR